MRYSGDTRSDGASIAAGRRRQGTDRPNKKHNLPMKSPNSKYLINAPAFSEHHGREWPTNKTTDIYLSAINLNDPPSTPPICGCFRGVWKLPAGCRSVVDAAVNSEPLHSGTQKSIGVIVFERSSGGVCATSAGRDFLRTARSILEQIDALVTSAKSNGRGEAGRLSVGIYTSLSAGNLRATLVVSGSGAHRSHLAWSIDAATEGAAILGGG